jgi:hypothetical protein
MLMTVLVTGSFTGKWSLRNLHPWNYSHNIAERNNSLVSLHNRLGQGTVFSLCLPLG